MMVVEQQLHRSVLFDFSTNEGEEESKHRSPPNFVNEQVGSYERPREVLRYPSDEYFLYLFVDLVTNPFFDVPQQRCVFVLNNHGLRLVEDYCNWIEREQSNERKMEFARSMFIIRSSLSFVEIDALGMQANALRMDSNGIFLTSLMEMVIMGGFGWGCFDIVHQMHSQLNPSRSVYSES